MDNEQALIPIEQETLIFRGLPLVVVRLPDGRPGVVLRWICENLGLAPTGQVTRIKRTEVIAGDLVYVQVQTEGGLQIMPTLVLDSAPYWLATIDTKRVKDPEQRLEILHYQKGAVAALFAWAAGQPKAIAAPTNLVPSEPITKPTPPADEASLEEWREYHRMMVAWIDWQHDIEQWQGTVEDRLEHVETMTSLIPEILERLPPATLTSAHQRRVQLYVQQLHEVSGKHQGTIHNELKTAFDVPRYQDIPEVEWDKVEHWFKVQLERGRKK